jgi:iron complex outermembrane receptor protein
MNRLSFYQPTLVAAAAAAFCAGAVQAQPQLVADATTTAGGSQQVVVTGVRGGQERTVADSPVPIDVISGEDLKLTGRADLKQALATLLPSFNYGTNLSGGDAYVRPLTNRGLGGAYTLVLVNGKRWHRSAMLAAAAGDASGANPVDIDFIPFSAIDHVEVLKDSAAAQYGSDAVAGVINIILKHANHGGDIGISGGKLYAGDGGNGKLLGDVGLKLPQDGFLDLSVELKHEGSAVYNAGPSTATPYFPLPNGSPDPRDATWNKVGEKNGDPKIDLVTTGANLELPLSAALKAYAFGTVAQRKTTLGNNVRLPSGSADIPEIFPDPYYPSGNDKDTDAQIVFGAKGSAYGWGWDFSNSFGRNRHHMASSLTINPSLGPSSPTSFGNLGTYIADQWVTDLDLTRGVDVGLADPLQVSVGAEYLSEGYKTLAGDPLAAEQGGYVFPALLPNGNPNPLAGTLASPGAQGVVAIAASDVVHLRRDDVAAYLDLGVNATPDWYLGAAVRDEHYDDSAGNTVGGKLNTRYDITRSFALRATAGTGFRAPSLTQIGFAKTDNRTGLDPDGNVVPALTKLLATDNPLAVALGAQPLKPERSKNLGFGVVLKPNKDSDLTLDAYQIDIKDRIVETNTLYGPALASLLTSYDVPTNAWIRYFANAVNTRTRGLDLVADTNVDYRAWGQVHWTAAFNWNVTQITHIRATPSVITSYASAGNPGGSLIWYGRSQQADLVVVQPKTKLILGADWTRGNWDLNASTTRYGDVSTWADNPTGDRHFGAKWITNLDVGYQLTRSWRLNAGATDLFSVRPDANAAPTSLGSPRYGTPPFSPAGGFWYGGATYSF